MTPSLEETQFIQGAKLTLHLALAYLASMGAFAVLRFTFEIDYLLSAACALAVVVLVAFLAGVHGFIAPDSSRRSARFAVLAGGVAALDLTGLYFLAQQGVGVYLAQASVLLVTLIAVNVLLQRLQGSSGFQPPVIEELEW